MTKARPRTGEKRKTNQPLNMDRLPPLVLESVLQLRNRAGKTWDEISALSAEPIGKGNLGFIDWAKLAPAVRKLFPGKRIPRTTLHRWFDLRVQQVSAEVAVKSAQATAIAESFAKSMLVNGNEAVVNAARDTIMNVLAEDSSAAGRESAAAELRKLADVMQRARANDIRERKVATEERKIKLLEDREAIARTKLETEAKNIERKRRSGSLKREDVERLVETVFGIAPKSKAAYIAKPAQSARLSQTAVFPLRNYQMRWIRDDARFKIAVKSARIGFSFATGFEAVEDCLEKSNDMWSVLSASKAQSVEFIETCSKFIKLLGGVAELTMDEDFFDEFGKIEAIQQRITFPNGSRIIALPANPRTARGYPGNAILDEYGHHEDSYAIWAAITRQVALGHKVRVLSTPNGEQGKFFDLCKELGLTDGEPEDNFQMRDGWSRHWIDCDMAIADGCPIDMKEMEDLIKDPDIVNQEFRCVFLQAAGAWIGLDLIRGCEDTGATVEWPVDYHARGTLFGGMDVARSQDQTIFVIKEKIADVLWTRLVKKLYGMTLTAQARELAPLIKLTQRTAMDSTGMGIGLFDMLNESCPGRVMGVNFAGSSRLRKEEQQRRAQSTGRGSTSDSVNMKTDLAIKLKKSFEDRRERIPYDLDLRTELQAIKRMPTASGVTFDAPRVTIETGVAGGKKQKGFAHADRFWAMGLATYASEGGLELGLTPSRIKTIQTQTRGYM